MRQLSRPALHCLLALAAAVLWTSPSPAADETLQVRVGYLAFVPAPGPLLSNVIPEPLDA